MTYVLSLDQGTTSSRAILFDHDGGVAGTAAQEFRQIYPNSGWVEHDPFEILTSQLGSAVAAMGKLGVRPRDVIALGITNQRETTIVWDRETGKPVYNAIVWQDGRTAELMKKLSDDGVEETVRQKTGLLLSPYFSASKVAWILDNVSGARARAEAGKLAFGTVDSWLVWNLTSGRRHITDRTNASRTLLYNIVEDRWDDDLLEVFRVPRSMLPEVVWSSERVGQVTTTLGLGEVEIAGIAGDQQSALFGQLCTSAGDAKNTYGTGCFLLQNIGGQFALSSERLVTTLGCSVERKPAYALEGSIFVGGAVVQWLRDNMRFIRRSSEVEEIADSVEDSGGVVFVPAFTGLGAPYWDAQARGLIIGLERGTQIGHIAKAAIESIAFQVADVLRAMDASSKSPLTELRVDGGAAANDALMQFQADLLGVPVHRPAVLETTALGAAYLAGLSTGFWTGVHELKKHRAADTVFQPKADKKKMERLASNWREAVARSRNWAAVSR
ncbi:MAG TPA: glycerol kinase GlpK [Edaphobacter sp.]|jgi:glycerol kinase|nr:glycerol kinase GlpK [Edaphobacter sp.]